MIFIKSNAYILDWSAVNDGSDSNTYIKGPDP